MLTRKIGKVLRGRVTPVQVLMATVLGSLIAFVPGLSQAPGLLLSLLLALIVLNANLGVALLVAVPARLIALAAMPVSFAIGRALLDGPTQGLFAALVDAPVLAWFGLDYYAVTGGQVLGLVVGLTTGGLLNLFVGRTRRKLANLQEGSERYQTLVARPWVRLMVLVFVGGRQKKSYAELLDKRVGNPIRIPGAIFAALVLTALWVLQSTLASPLLAVTARTELEQSNGATVDLDTVELDLGAGRLVVRELAIADPNALDTDLFRAGTIEADVSTGDLLRRRLTIDRLLVSDARHGAPRAVPGVRVERRGTHPAPDPEPPAGDEKTLEDYLSDYETYRARLQQAREWLERLAGADDGAPGDAEAEESLRERLEREVAAKGYAGVRADHLRTAGPTLLVSELSIEGLVSASLPDEVLELRATNLSTHPRLVDEPARIELTSKSGDLGATLGLDALSSEPGANVIAFHRRGLPVDAVADGLVVDGVHPVSGGTLDLRLDGSWAGDRVGEIDLPLDVTLHDTDLTIPGQGSTHVQAFSLPILLRGPLDALRVSVDQAALQDALVQAGADELVGRAQDAAQEVLGDQAAELREKAAAALGDELGGETTEQLEKKAGGLLEGLLGGDKKKKKP